MGKVEYILDRDIFDESIREIAKKKVVIDIGAGSPFRKGLSKYSSLFKDSYYYSLDIRFHPQLSVIADIQELPFKDESSDGIICNAVMDFVFEPHRAVKEIYRILKKEGVAFLYVSFLSPYQGTKDQRDLYRFTKDGLIYLFRNFNEIKLQPRGGYINTSINFMTGFKFKNRSFMHFLEKPLYVLANFLLGKAMNRLHNPTGFNILLKK